jgi:hypothetical protein
VHTRNPGRVTAALLSTEAPSAYEEEEETDISIHGMSYSTLLWNLDHALILRTRGEGFLNLPIDTVLYIATNR